MPILVDSNIWLPLVWEGHVKHGSAKSWFTSQSESLCFCRITQLALLRHLTHASILKEDALSNSAALSVVQQLQDSSSVRLLPEPVGVQERWMRFGKTMTKSPQLWTDAYLAAFAVAGNLRFATYDKGFSKFEGLDLDLLR